MALSIAKDFIRLETPLSPQSPEQWKQAIQEVKLLYLQRQYKQCAARSFEILEAVRGPVSRTCCCQHRYALTCSWSADPSSLQDMPLFLQRHFLRGDGPSGP